MNFRKYFFLLLYLLIQIQAASAQTSAFPVSFDISFDENLMDKAKSEGRLFIFLSTQSRPEPRTMTWPTSGNNIFAQNFLAVDLNSKISLSSADKLQKNSDWSLDQVPQGTYYVQALWDQDKNESRIDAPGNIYSEVAKVEISKAENISLSLSKIIEPTQIMDNKYVKEVTLHSTILSKWWEKDMIVKASVLLPRGYYDEPTKKYPVRYNVAGYGGRYTRVNNLMGNKSFSDWWFSEDAPQIINVFLDGEGPFGDSYQMDSDNSGPYGKALTEELIPFIESTYRGTGSAKYRFVDGCSTGGWVSLALQLFYPEEFNGVWSYSPDAVEFENYQLINIYKDENAYINEFNIERPVARTVDGEPMMLLHDFISYENVLGWSDSYVTSGGQFSAHNALYGPKGADGLPKPLFDPESGEIDHQVAELWKKYDLLLYTQEHWDELGPKIQGKVYIWMGDMDNFYLNMATRSFDDFLKNTQNPVSDAEVVFTPLKGHCANYSNKVVLQQIAEKLETME